MSSMSTGGRGHYGGGGGGGSSGLGARGGCTPPKMLCGHRGAQPGVPGCCTTPTLLCGRRSARLGNQGYFLPPPNFLSAKRDLLDEHERTQVRQRALFCSLSSIFWCLDQAVAGCRCGGGARAHAGAPSPTHPHLRPAATCKQHLEWALTSLPVMGVWRACPAGGDFSALLQGGRCHPPA